MTLLVYSRKGDASLAIKNSSSPIPIANGLPNRATTISSGLFLSKTAIAYAPITWFKLFELPYQALHYHAF